MPRFPVLSGKKIIKALSKIGYFITRRHSSHIRLSCPNKRSVTVPDYKVVSRGLARKILRDTELSFEEFIKLL